jgi:hypothetical protein
LQAFLFSVLGGVWWGVKPETVQGNRKQEVFGAKMCL